MAKYPELVDVNPSLNLNTPELQVKVDRQRAADIGVRMTDVSDAVRLFYSGEDEITRFKEGSEQYPVTMQLLPEQRDNPEVLARMMVPSSKLGQVRLENVATIQRGAGPATLQRYNREFQVSVYANVGAGYPLDLAAAQFKVSREKLSPDDDFFKKLGIDSLQALSLLTRLEQHFNVELPDYELQGVSDFRTLAERIQARL